MAVVAVCALSDAVLINVGVRGMGIGGRHNTRTGARGAGVWRAVPHRLRLAQPAAAWSPQALAVDAAHQRTPLARCAGNHLCTGPGSTPRHLTRSCCWAPWPALCRYERAAFAAGASLASAVVHHPGLGARWLAPLFATPQAWRGIPDAGIALLMLGLAALLLRPAGWAMPAAAKSSS